MGKPQINSRLITFCRSAEFLPIRQNRVRAMPRTNGGSRREASIVNAVPRLGYQGVPHMHANRIDWPRTPAASSPVGQDAVP
jgi:hypothetical protein